MYNYIRILTVMIIVIINKPSPSSSQSSPPPWSSQPPSLPPTPPHHHHHHHYSYIKYMTIYCIYIFYFITDLLTKCSFISSLNHILVNNFVQHHQSCFYMIFILFKHFINTPLYQIKSSSKLVFEASYF